MRVSTRFEGMSAGLAKAVLAALAVAVLLLVVYALLPTGGPKGAVDGKGDIYTYEQVVRRLQAGEAYYQALYAELIAGGFGVQSIFNWRPPFFLSAVALSPWPQLPQAVLIALAAAGLLLGRRLVGDVDSQGIKLGLSAMLALSLMLVLPPEARLMCEIYAGVLILISATAYGQKLPWLGFAAGALALLVRELSVVYVLICLAFALREGRRREAVAWVVALIGFSFYYGWHARMAMAMVKPDDPGYAQGWLQFGGVAFDLATARFNGVFQLLPKWLSAVILALGVLGLLAWPATARDRILLTVLAYLVVFAMVGKTANIYWGALYTPLLAFGTVWAIPALRDLWQAATKARVMAR